MKGIIVGPLVVLCLLATPAWSEVLERVFPRVLPEKEAVGLVDVDGETVGAIGLFEKDGYYGFLLITLKKSSQTPENATMELDSGPDILFKCLTMVYSGAQMVTCATKSPVFLERLSRAAHVKLWTAKPGARRQARSLEVDFSGRELAHLRASVSPASR